MMELNCFVNIWCDTIVKNMLLLGNLNQNSTVSPGNLSEARYIVGYKVNIKLL